MTEYASAMVINSQPIALDLHFFAALLPTLSLLLWVIMLEMGYRVKSRAHLLSAAVRCGARHGRRVLLNNNNWCSSLKFRIQILLMWCFRLEKRQVLSQIWSVCSPCTKICLTAYTVVFSATSPSLSASLDMNNPEHENSKMNTTQCFFNDVKWGR